MTDKATVMIKSRTNGTVAKLAAKEGEVATVGQVIITIETGGASAPGPAPAPGTTTPSKPAEEEKTLFDLPTNFSGGSKLKKQQTAPAPSPGPTPARAPAPAPAQRSATLAAPAIRWAAREKG